MKQLEFHHVFPNPDKSKDTVLIKFEMLSLIIKIRNGSPCKHFVRSSELDADSYEIL